jgi:hypothetical protein
MIDHASCLVAGQLHRDTLRPPHPMQPSLTMTIVGFDEDYLEIEIRASNDRFAGTVRVYVEECRSPYREAG